MTSTMTMTPAATKPKPATRRKPNSVPKGPSNKPQQRPEDMIADRILELLDQGNLPPWNRPWKYSAQSMVHNAVSKKPYRGINIWLLAVSTMLNGYDDPRWLTFKQARQLGGHIKKDEKSTWIVFWKILHKKSDETGQPDNVQTFDPEQSQTQGQAPPRTQGFPMARIYNVFNANQTEDCDLPQLQATLTDQHDPIASAEEIIAGMPHPPLFETFLHENRPPHYIPIADKARVPHVSRYDHPELYYNSVFHELVHSTGHEKRLSRFKSSDIGSESLHDYALEELVAGMGAAMLSARAQMDHVATEENAASYIDYWSKKIRADKSIVLSAAQKAQRAFDYICPPPQGNDAEHPTTHGPDTEVIEPQDA